MNVDVNTNRNKDLAFIRKLTKKNIFVNFATLIFVIFYFTLLLIIADWGTRNSIENSEAVTNTFWTISVIFGVILIILSLITLILSIKLVININLSDNLFGENKKMYFVLAIIGIFIWIIQIIICFMIMKYLDKYKENYVENTSVNTSVNDGKNLNENFDNNNTINQPNINLNKNNFECIGGNSDVNKDKNQMLVCPKCQKICNINSMLKVNSQTGSDDDFKYYCKWCVTKDLSSSN